MSVYHLLFLSASVAALFLHGYTYPFHLLHVVLNNDILRRVIQAVTKNGDQLLWVGFLLVIIIYL